MSHFHPMLHVALLHGVQETSALRESVGAFAAANSSALVNGRIAIFAGDESETSHATPDRSHDLSGAPLFLVLTPLAPDAIDAGMDHAAEHLGRCSRRVETWFLRERFARGSQRTHLIDRSWLQIVMLNVDPLAEGEFNEWDEQEHVVRIGSEAPEFVGVQLLEAIDGWPNHHEFWRLTDRTGPERDPWLSASETPWTRRLRRFTHDRRTLLMAPMVL
jgi:hypothetical protein